MADPLITLAACSGLEKAINAGLQLDPVTQAKLTPHTGTVIHITCLNPHAEAYIRIGPACEVMQYYEGDIEVSIEGKLSEWLELLTANDKASSLINGQLSITGNSQLLIELRQLAAQLELDWEGQLASFIGDVPAHLIGKAAKSTAAFGSRLNQTLIRTIDDFIHEETRLLPSKNEVNNFYQALRALEMRTERVAAQLLQHKQNNSDATSTLSENKK